MSRLPQCKAREVVRALEVLGFVLIRQIREAGVSIDEFIKALSQ